MKPVFQTKFGDGQGNCFPACVASILEIDLEKVPECCHDDHPEGWDSDFQKWLRKRGYFFLETELRGDPRVVRMLKQRFGWHIITGKAETGVMHAVCAYQERVYHDPHPGWKGKQLSPPLYYGFLIQRDPRQADLYGPFTVNDCPELEHIRTHYGQVLIDDEVPND